MKQKISQNILRIFLNFFLIFLIYQLTIFEVHSGSQGFIQVVNRGSKIDKSPSFSRTMLNSSKISMVSKITNKMELFTAKPYDRPKLHFFYENEDYQNCIFMCYENGYHQNDILKSLRHHDTIWDDSCCLPVIHYIAEESIYAFLNTKQFVYFPYRHNKDNNYRFFYQFNPKEIYYFFNTEFYNRYNKNNKNINNLNIIIVDTVPIDVGDKVFYLLSAMDYNSKKILDIEVSNYLNVSVFLSLIDKSLASKEKPCNLFVFNSNRDFAVHLFLILNTINPNLLKYQFPITMSEKKYRPKYNYLTNYNPNNKKHFSILHYGHGGVSINLYTGYDYISQLHSGSEQKKFNDSLQELNTFFMNCKKIQIDEEDEEFAGYMINDYRKYYNDYNYRFFLRRNND